jgi:hypothetical protein
VRINVIAFAFSGMNDIGGGAGWAGARLPQARGYLELLLEGSALAIWEVAHENDTLRTLCVQLSHKVGRVRLRITSMGSNSERSSDDTWINMHALPYYSTDKLAVKDPGRGIFRLSRIYAKTSPSNLAVRVSTM